MKLSQVWIKLLLSNQVNEIIMGQDVFECGFNEIVKMNVSWGSVQLIIYIRNGKLYNLFFNSKMNLVKGMVNRPFVVFVC